MELIKSNTSRVALVAGASRGIGLALVNELLMQGDWHVLAACRQPDQAQSLINLRKEYVDQLTLLSLDATDEQSLANFKQQCLQHCQHIDLVFNTIGLLHGPDLKPEKSLRQMRLANLHSIFAANAFAPILLAQSVSALLAKSSQSWFVSLSARVGSISDNQLGGWYSYRAAKAAQNQLLKTLSIEWARTQPNTCVLVMHPGTTDTDLSKPFQRNVPESKLFSAKFVATSLLALTLSKNSLDSGQFLAWNGELISW
ncbi:MAG: SDR family NAD(P)-dependent oxidoreductase [Moraxellaceae bacterium]|nr:SDR family NAD(P)-dependent oxidoreductase [Moraxellaceae bacterium]MDP1776468.1 SDR family NAD(P)-dependent oxidoreductase [Moraxellaceae bacterium]MDZ4298912.1 SDR family NAD(P)-dependent oxidoreductase [Moraxellaceae bacterium]MDZ4387671.1 SDR family NAD(P)-dependent oxidoreductase [Moraxellaceae bacterium]